MCIRDSPVAEQLDKISENILREHTNNDKKPHLTAITVGENPASLLYVSRKQEKAIKLGVEFNWIKLDAETTQDKLDEVISAEAKVTDGVIIQLPLPNHLNPEEAINCIPHEVDVDGLTCCCCGNDWFIAVASGLLELDPAAPVPCKPPRCLRTLDGRLGL